MLTVVDHFFWYTSEHGEEQTKAIQNILLEEMVK